MSTQSGQGPDLSRIVSLIMQNPDLIRQIEALAKQDAPEEAESLEEITPHAAPQMQVQTREESTQASALPQGLEKREKRTRLLTALRPYVSEKRGKTLDTLIGAMDLFDLMGRG